MSYKRPAYIDQSLTMNDDTRQLIHRQCFRFYPRKCNNIKGFEGCGLPKGNCCSKLRIGEKI
jgi:hypothetical protein